jgi:hypothetical protein
MSKNPNWQAMQTVSTMTKAGKVWHPQKDVNVKCMSMGSWRANAAQGGAKRRKGGGGDK